MRRALLVLTALFLANCAALRILLVDLSFQFQCVALLVALALCGLRAFLHLRTAINDAVFLLVCGLALGAAAYVVLLEVLFHRRVLALIGAPSLESCARAVLIPLVIAAILSAVRILRDPQRLGPWPRSAPVVGAAIVACLLSGSTIYGIFNQAHRIRTAHLPADHALRRSNLPRWGTEADIYAHLVYTPHRIHAKRLPGETAGHHGVPLMVMGAALSSGEFHEANLVQAAKIFAPWVWFCLLYSVFFTARRALELPSWAAGLAAVSAALFAPLNVPFFTLKQSSYLGLISPSGPLVHNITQLYSLAVGLPGIALVALFLSGRGERRILALGCLLISASFLFKPSLYTVAAPAAFCACAFAFWEARRARFLGALVLLAPVIAWTLYTRSLAVPTVLGGLELRPFYFLFQRSADRFPPWVTEHDVLFGLSILLASCAAFTGPLITMTATRPRRAEIFLLAVFGLGLASATLFVEAGPRWSHGNFLWGGAAGYLAALPALYALLLRCPVRWVGAASWMIVPLHLWNGVLHLYLAAFQGRIA